MEARFDVFSSELLTTFVRKLNGASQVLADCALPMRVQELVKLRASQINGCSVCTDMHSKDALAAGDTAQRLLLVGAWRDATVFSEAERAALALTEEGTRIADGDTGISDDVWQAGQYAA